LVRVKTSTESISGLRSSSTSSALLRSRGTGYTACVTVVVDVLRRPDLAPTDRAGAGTCAASASTSGGIVALKRQRLAIRRTARPRG
jgi:hypothetical protein